MVNVFNTLSFAVEDAVDFSCANSKCSIELAQQ